MRNKCIGIGLLRNFSRLYFSMNKVYVRIHVHVSEAWVFEEKDKRKSERDRSKEDSSKKDTKQVRRDLRRSLYFLYIVFQ